jgi:hypothetical protein
VGAPGTHATLAGPSASGEGATAPPPEQSPSGETTPPGHGAASPAAVRVPDGNRPFEAWSPWNSPIPDNPVLDSGSAAKAAALTPEHRAFADIQAFGVPIYDAGESTPRVPVRCTQTNWGTCGLEKAPVPIPAGAKPSSGSDGAMVVVDWTTDQSYEFWQARDTSSGWSAGWGDVRPIASDGTSGSSVGAGVSRLAGVVRRAEIEQGHIEHALVFSTSNACQSEFRHPATKTDGPSTRPDCLPEGSRIQLDPSINLDTIPMPAGERAVGKALQTYGAYAVDKGGAPMAFIFESPRDGWDPYPAVGFDHDYADMTHLPWSSLRVLRQWDGR